MRIRNRHRRSWAARSIILSATTMLIVSALMMAACSSGTDNGDGGSANGGTTATWSIDTDCTSCHAAQGASQETASSLSDFHLGKGNACTSCHLKTDIVPVHEKYASSGRSAQQLRYTEVPEDACLSCHGSYEDLASKTDALTSIADTNGTVVNPHALPVTSTLGQGHDTLTCVSCHGGHNVADTVQASLDTCFGCHHMKVFECGTCHE